MGVSLTIEKLVYGGSGLARLDGSVVFVPFVLPGEQVEVELASKGTGILRGSAVGWTTRSADRASPPCPVFTRCGGCHYQHVSYERQREVKVAILLETLRRIAGVDWEGDVDVIAAEEWGYRNRAQLRLGRDGGEISVGFRESGTHRHVAVEQCAINSPRLNTLLDQFRSRAGEFWRRGAPRAVEFFTDERRVQINVPRWRGPVPPAIARRFADCFGVKQLGRPLDYRCGADVFRVSGRSFFQVNRFLIERLVEAAIGPVEGSRALDLYCGVGLLSIPLARRFHDVVGVDSSRTAVRDLRRNAGRAGVPVRAVQADVAKFLAGCDVRPDLVVADPPRSGLGRAVVGHLLRIAPARLHLVSCDPATLARDIKTLVGSGYVLERLTLIDLFPQTYHIESVAVLSGGARTRPAPA